MEKIILDDCFLHKLGLLRLFLERSVIKIFNQNAHWDVCYTHTYKNLGMTIFYLLPTVMYDRDIDLEDEYNHSFSISLNWLFHCLCFSRYW